MYEALRGTAVVGTYTQYLSLRIYLSEKVSKVVPGPRPVAFVSWNFTDYVSMALCMEDNRVGTKLSLK